jgi:hypothetical protein
LEFLSHSVEKFRHFLKSIVHQPATSNISFIITQRHLQGWPSKLRCRSSGFESLTVFLIQTTWRTLSSLRCQVGVLIRKFPEFHGTHKFLSPVFRSRVEFFLHNVTPGLRRWRLRPASRLIYCALHFDHSEQYGGVSVLRPPTKLPGAC